MKRLLLLLILVGMSPAANAGYMGIVDRTATRDTLAIPFQFLDSLGEAVDDATNDSVYIMVWSPGGTEVFRDSMLATDGSITSSAWEDFAGGDHYTYNERISILDGSSSADGVFTYQLVTWDNSLSLQTHYYGSFQIVNDVLESSLDDATLALAEVVNINAWAPILDNDSLIVDQSSLEDLALNIDNFTGSTG